MNPSAAARRPILISTVQYQDELAAGVLRVPDLLDKAQRFGVDGVELRPSGQIASPDALAETRRQSIARDLLVTYATFSTLLAPDENAYERLAADIEIAHALGSPLLRVFSGTVPPNEFDPAWNNARRAVAHAAARGVVLALENAGQAPGATLAEMERVLNNIAEPALGANIDLGNYAASGQDVSAAIHAIGHRAVYAHLKDLAGAGTTHLGGGTLPLNALLDELDRWPQPLLYCFEFAGENDGDARIEKSMAFLRARQGTSAR